LGVFHAPEQSLLVSGMLCLGNTPEGSRWRSLLHSGHRALGPSLFIAFILVAVVVVMTFARWPGGIVEIVALEALRFLLATGYPGLLPVPLGRVPALLVVLVSASEVLF